MKIIYILLTRSETVLSKAVRLITDDTYTHISISFDSRLRLLYSSSRKNGRTIFPAGPCRESLTRGYYKRHSHIPCAICALHVEDDVYYSVKKEVGRIISDPGRCHFNILGLLLCHFNIPFRRRRHFFCSQFVSEVLRNGRALGLPKEPALMRPVDYMWLPELTLLFQGRIDEYAKAVDISRVQNAGQPA